MKVRSYHHGDLKQALIEAALDLLREQGVSGLSLRAIAARAKVSHMAPYSHFRNKKELVQAVAAAGFDELTRRLIELRKVYVEPGERVLNYGVAYVQFAVENPDLYRLMLSQSDLGGQRASQERGSREGFQISPRLESSSRRPFELLRDEFARSGGDPLRVTARAATAWSMVHGMAALMIDGHLELPEGMSVRELFIMAVSPAMMKV
ncbi:MAG: TetR/AcrR family transcriptional regulator [Gammaproteobacteria bacterium]|nr:MAG: TetR/AcrR family transcriptional regulator [Gammaproteobacteria bacterium]